MNQVFQLPAWVPAVPAAASRDEQHGDRDEQTLFHILVIFMQEYLIKESDGLSTVNEQRT